MIILGEDYGEGASVIQERSHAFAMKSSMWLLDPRPSLPAIVNLVERGFELSEASNSVVMMQLRIRTCHVYGRFAARNNRTGKFSRNNPIQQPDFSMIRLPQPPYTVQQEKIKLEQRFPAALKFIAEHKLNEMFSGDLGEIGIGHDARRCEGAGAEDDGEDDGDSLGDELGDVDGLPLGEDDGLEDGDVLGLADGDVLGLVDGDVLGLVDGDVASLMVT